jgi:hypothetical protein
MYPSCGLKRIWLKMNRPPFPSRPSSPRRLWEWYRRALEDLRLRSAFVVCAAASCAFRDADSYAGEGTGSQDGPNLLAPREGTQGLRRVSVCPCGEETCCFDPADAEYAGGGGGRPTRRMAGCGRRGHEPLSCHARHVLCRRLLAIVETVRARAEAARAAERQAAEVHQAAVERQAAAEAAAANARYEAEVADTRYQASRRMPRRRDLMQIEHESAAAARAAEWLAAQRAAEAARARERQAAAAAAAEDAGYEDGWMPHRHGRLRGLLAMAVEGLREHGVRTIAMECAGREAGPSKQAWFAALLRTLVDRFRLSAADMGFGPDIGSRVDLVVGAVAKEAEAEAEAAEAAVLGGGWPPSAEQLVSVLGRCGLDDARALVEAAAASAAAGGAGAVEMSAAEAEAATKRLVAKVGARVPSQLGGSCARLIDGRRGLHGLEECRCNGHAIPVFSDCKHHKDFNAT